MGFKTRNNNNQPRTKRVRPSTEQTASSDSAPTIIRSSRSDSSSSQSSLGGAEIWIRISAFLSLRSPNTQSTYAGILREWLRFLGAEFGSANGANAFLKASDLHAAAYRNWLLEQPGEAPRMQRSHDNGPRTNHVTALTTKGRASAYRTKRTGLEDTQANATIAKKLSALRRIYRMAAGAGLIANNPFDSDQVPPPSKDAGKKRPTEMLDFKLVKKVLAQPDIKTPKGLRDAALLAVLFGGALRRSEAATLRIGDVKHTAAKTMFLYLRSTKAKNDASQAVPSWVAAIVNKLLLQRRSEHSVDGDFLFISYSGKGGLIPTRSGISPSGIYKLFKMYCKKANVSPFITPHSARATAITKLLTDGIPHREVKEFSRHASIQMVEVYDKRRMSVDESPGKLLSFDDEE